MKIIRTLFGLSVMAVVAVTLSTPAVVFADPTSYQRSTEACSGNANCHIVHCYDCTSGCEQCTYDDPCSNPNCSI